MNNRQCKAARALLGWTQFELGQHAGVSTTEVSEFERWGRASEQNALAMCKTFEEREGLTFVFGGVVYAAEQKHGNSLEHTQDTDTVGAEDIFGGDWLLPGDKETNNDDPSGVEETIPPVV